MERLLIVANDFPYPPNHGGAVDLWWRLQALKKLGFAVDLVATPRAAPPLKDVEAVRGEVNELFIIERDRDWKAALSWQPFQVRSRRGLQTAPVSQEYLAVILEAEHVASILRNPSLRAKKRILRIHNNEARFFHELSKSTSGFFKTLFYRSEAAKFGAFSAYVISRCDALWFISDLEMKEHVKRNPADYKKSFFVPPAVEASLMRRQSLQGRKAIFIGTLTLPFNISGVEWYVANVHPLLCDVLDYELLIAGNTRGTRDHPLSGVIKLRPHITLREDPEDTQELYQDAAVFINPVLRGAGLKMKTIDAIRAGVPVVTTSIGIEGSRLIHGKHVLVADSAHSFADCVRRLLNDKILGQALVASAQEFLAREYDQERIVTRSLSRIFLA